MPLVPGGKSRQPYTYLLDVLQVKGSIRGHRIMQVFLKEKPSPARASQVICLEQEVTDQEEVLKQGPQMSVQHPPAQVSPAASEALSLDKSMRF